MNATPLYPEELTELLQTAKSAVTQALELWATDEHDRVYRELAARALRQYAQAHFKMTQLCEDGEGDQAEAYLTRGMQAQALAERITEGLISPQEALEFGRQRRVAEAGRLLKSRHLIVYSSGSDFCTVTRGSEPHRASLECCDCADFRYGNVCKHILAVYRHRGIPVQVGEALLVNPAPYVNEGE